MVAEIQVISNGALQSGPKTAGMTRRQALATDELWMGEVRTEPGARSGWHHHGEYITYGYVVAGRLRFEYGPGADDYVEAGPGDFFVVPPHTAHREGNPANEEQVLVGLRFGSGPTVVNVGAPDAR